MTDIVERLHMRAEIAPDYPLMQEAADEIERLGALAAIVREQGIELIDRRADNERLQEQVASLQASSGYEASIAQLDNERLRAALHNIAIGGNGERNWTLDEVRAVAWDALKP